LRQSAFNVESRHEVSFFGESWIVFQVGHKFGIGEVITSPAGLGLFLHPCR
jgi:hypothetical protein